MISNGPDGKSVSICVYLWENKIISVCKKNIRESENRVQKKSEDPPYYIYKVQIFTLLLYIIPSLRRDD